MSAGELAFGYEGHQLIVVLDAVTATNGFHLLCGLAGQNSYRGDACSDGRCCTCIPAGHVGPLALLVSLASGGMTSLSDNKCINMDVDMYK